MVKSRRTKAIDFIIALFCLIIMTVTLLPFLNVAASSLSSPQAIIKRLVSVWPVEFTLDSYIYVFHDPSFSRSLIWTICLTLICATFSMLLTVLCAYPLTYDFLKGKRALNSIMIMTMYFNAGIIPNYILMKDLNLIDNPLVLIVPNALSVFNVIILKSFFYGIPESLRESAEMDGANPFTTLVRIYLPLSTSVLATLTLFYAVGRWNGFADALQYMNDQKWQPIQLKLYYIINNRASIEIAQNEGLAGGVPATSEGLQAASIMFATIPILLAYPWLQRYFITGVTIGAVKG